MHEQHVKPSWIADLRAGIGPRYLQIADMLERAIAKGILRPEQRIPAQRDLAAYLKVDLTTVTRALNEARRRQLINTRGPLGTFVARPKVQLTPIVDLSMNIPPVPEGIDLEDLLRDGVSQVLIRSNIELLMTYQMGGGSNPDCAAAALWLQPALDSVDLDQLVVCPGAQAALAAILLTASSPGDVIFTEPLVYPGLALAASQLGRRIETIAADDAGMRPDALEAACQTYGPRLVYLNPTLQNPTSRTMPELRRRDIAKVAAKCNLKIIEDDPYWLLADAAPPPLAQLVPESVYYLSTLSKCLSPGLRTAFLRLPEASMRETFLTALRSVALMCAPLMGALVTQWIYDGTALQFLAAIRSESRSRQKLAARILLDHTAEEGQGIHIWHTLPEYWAAPDLAIAALHEGLVVAPSTAFLVGATGAATPNAIRVSLGGSSSHSKLEGALWKLADMINRRPVALQHLTIHR